MGSSEASVRLLPKVRITQREFTVESKRFLLTEEDLVTERSVLMTEFGQGRLFHLSIEVGCAEWLSEYV